MQTLVPFTVVDMCILELERDIHIDSGSPELTVLTLAGSPTASATRWRSVPSKNNFPAVKLHASVFWQGPRLRVLVSGFRRMH